MWGFNDKRIKFSLFKVSWVRRIQTKSSSLTWTLIFVSVRTDRTLKIKNSQAASVSTAHSSQGTFLKQIKAQSSIRAKESPEKNPSACCESRVRPSSFAKPEKYPPVFEGAAPGLSVWWPHGTRFPCSSIVSLFQLQPGGKLEVVWGGVCECVGGGHTHGWSAPTWSRTLRFAPYIW